LAECEDFEGLLRTGHELKDGAMLTSMSNRPFEMSFKCVRCGRVFWFENPSWRERRVFSWRLTQESREEAREECIALQPALVAAQLNRRNGILHP
jgi:hypothetical protein